MPFANSTVVLSSFVCNPSSLIFSFASRSDESYYNDSPSLSGTSCYPSLIRVQSATDDNQLQRRVFTSSRSSKTPFWFSPPIQSSLSLSRMLDPLTSEHDVCGLNYSGGFTRDDLDHALKDPLV